MSLIRTFKELTRHLLRQIGIERQLSYLQGDRKDNFTAIYEQRIWTHGNDDMPLSGFGSSLDATATLRDALPDLLRRIDAKIILDLGCGDFTWMQHVDLPCDYIGVDIVSSVIENNQQRFSAPERTFILTDFVNEPLPAADVVLCREVLFHLSFEDVKAGLRNALSTGCTHALLTSDEGTAYNADIRSGDFRLLNLQKQPFKLPPPKSRIDDSAVAERRFVGLWTAEDVLMAIG